MKRVTISAKSGRKDWNEKELSDLKLNVLYQMADKWIVDASDSQLEKISKMGYRVKSHVNSNSIKFGRFQIKPDSTIPKIPSAYKLDAKAEENWIHFLVKLIGPSLPEWVKQVQELGFEVVEVIGQDVLFVCGNMKNRVKLGDQYFVEFYYE